MAAVSSPKCYSCNNTKPKMGTQTGKLLLCSGCKTVYYCSSDCQKTDWPNHRQSCAQLKQNVDPSHFSDPDRAALAQKLQGRHLRRENHPGTVDLFKTVAIAARGTPNLTDPRQQALQKELLEAANKRDPTKIVAMAPRLRTNLLEEVQRTMRGIPPEEMKPEREELDQIAERWKTTNGGSPQDLESLFRIAARLMPETQALFSCMKGKRTNY